MHIKGDIVRLRQGVHVYMVKLEQVFRTKGADRGHSGGFDGMESGASVMISMQMFLQSGTLESLQILDLCLQTGRLPPLSVR